MIILNVQASVDDLNEHQIGNAWLSEQPVSTGVTGSLFPIVVIGVRDGIIGRGHFVLHILLVQIEKRNLGLESIESFVQVAAHVVGNSLERVYTVMVKVIVTVVVATVRDEYVLFVAMYALSIGGLGVKPYGYVEFVRVAAGRIGKGGVGRKVLFEFTFALILIVGNRLILVEAHVAVAQTIAVSVFTVENGQLRRQIGQRAAATTTTGAVFHAVVYVLA